MPVHKYPNLFGSLDWEIAEHYEPGGYHPINIGDSFNQGRYRVLDKLARGGNSTIWLVEDTNLHRLASLKVLTADASSTSSELEISRYLQRLQERDDSHPGKAHVVTIFDTFVHTGPNGVHQCIVTEVLGISLDQDLPLKFYEKDLRYHPSQITTKIAPQIALGLAYLHQCGIVHGDLNLAHVLFHSNELQNVSPAERSRIYGEVKEVPISYWWMESLQRPNNLPEKFIYKFPSKAVFDACLTPHDAVHVKICDFGLSSLCNSSLRPRLDPPLLSHLPEVYCAPEILLEDIELLTHSTDIWAYGILFHMIMNNKRGPFPDDGVGDKNYMLGYMTMILGMLPDHWDAIWPARLYFYKEDLQRVPCVGMSITSKDMDIADEEIAIFVKILYSIFRYDPQQRISAENVVKLFPPGWIDGKYKKNPDNSTEGPKGQEENGNV